jgi:O-antigen/teichoic acid export membrane protein
VGDLLDTPEAGRTAARGAVVRVAGHAAGVGLSVVAAVLLFRYLGVQDAGRYVAVTSLATVGVQVTDAGLTGVATRELAVLRERDSHRFLTELLGVRLLFGAIGVLVAVGLALAFGWSSELVLGTFLTGLGVLVLAVAHNVGALLGSRLRWGAVAGVELARNAANAVALALLVVAGASLGAFFVAPLASSLVALAVTLSVTRHHSRPALRAGLRNWRSMAADLMPLALAAAVGVIYLRAAMVLTSLVASADEAGWFAAAFRIVEVAAAVPVLAAGAMTPVLARAARDDRARHSMLARRTIASCALLGVGLAAVTALAAPLCIRVVGGPGFAESVPVLRIEAIALGLACVSAAPTITLLSLRVYRDILVTGLIGLVALTAATLVLAPAHGAEGSAVATVIGEAMWLAGAAVCVVRRGVFGVRRTAVSGVPA